MKNKTKKVSAIEIKEMGGLKCDNPDCDWRNDDIKVEEYENYINYPCPKCGCNVFTMKDYKSFKAILKLIKILNFVLPKRKVTGDNLVTIKCEFKGDRKINSVIKEVREVGGSELN